MFFVLSIAAVAALSPLARAQLKEVTTDVVLAKIQADLGDATKAKLVSGPDGEWIYVMPAENNPTGKIRVYSSETGLLARQVDVAPGNTTDTKWDIDLAPNGKLYVLQGREGANRLIEVENPYSKVTLKQTPMPFAFEGYTDIVHLAHGDDGRMRVLAKDKNGEPTYIFFKIDDSKKPPEVKIDQTLTFAELKKRAQEAIDRMKEIDAANGTNSAKELLDREIANTNKNTLLSNPTDPVSSCALPQPSVGSPSLVQTLKDSFSIAGSVMGGPCGTDADLAISLDLKPIRDSLMQTGWLRRKEKNFGTVAIDVGMGAAYDIVGGLLEYTMMKIAGADTTYQGMVRLADTLGERGVAAWYEKATGPAVYKDPNHGSLVNLMHHLPHFGYTTYLQMTGSYSELEMIAMGTFAQVVIHELLYEPWEAWSLNDLPMNELGVLAAAILHMGNRLERSLLNGLFTNTFYVEDGNRKYTIGFQQIPGLQGLSVENLPVRPWNLVLGVEFTPEEAKWMTLGASVNFMTDKAVKENFFDSFSINRTQVGLTCRARLP